MRQNTHNNQSINALKGMQQQVTQTAIQQHRRMPRKIKLTPPYRITLDRKPLKHGICKDIKTWDGAENILRFVQARPNYFGYGELDIESQS